MADLFPIPKGYQDLLSLLKSRIRTAQLRASTAVNQHLVLLYWGIGNEILKRQRDDGWGTKVIERLAKDLGTEFPEMRGFSARNLGYMKAFAEVWQDEGILQQLAAKLPWFHNCVLLDKVKHSAERHWYGAGDSKRLEPQCSCDANRIRVISSAGEGLDEFSANAARSAV